ncbi:MAG: caspase family protein, partial [Candidatus Delongbacteria bacterium]|nr:caspase family protein [Candidatus Delongbacteria bacterium]MCG2760849.1 caspase family protein [Candidatus Delongbacteria bacterium]
MHCFKFEKNFTFPILLLIILAVLSCGKEQKQEQYLPESSLTENVENTESEILNSDSLDMTPEIFVQMGHISGSFSYTNALEFIQNGKYILSGSGDGTIKLWETQSGREVKTFKCEDDVTNLDVSTSGKYLVSGDMNFVNNINIWDISSGKKLKSFRSESSCNGHPVFFCNDDKNILFGAGDQTISLWDIESSKLIMEYKVDSKDSLRNPDVSSVVITKGEKKIIAGYRYNGTEEVDGYMQEVQPTDNTIRIWDLKTGIEIIAFNKGNGWVEALEITPDGKHILSGDYRQDSVRVWDIDTGRQINSFSTNGTSAIAVSSGGRYALLGGCMGFRLIELSTGKEIRKIDKGIDGWVRSIKFSPDGKYALVGDNTSKPMLWNLESGKISKEFGGYTNQLETIKISKTGNVMLTADDYNDAVNIWDYQNGRLLKTIDRDSSSIMSSATISSDGKLMATGGWNGRTSNAIVWDIATSKQIVKMELEEEASHHTEFLQFSDDNKYLIWANQNKITISDIKTGKKIKAISDSLLIVRRIYVNSNSGYIIAPSHALQTRLYSFPDGEFLKLLGKDSFVYGKDHIYEFSSVRNEDGSGERLFAIYDLKTLENLSKRKIKEEGSYFSDGIEYNSNYLFFSGNFSQNINKYDIKSEKVVAELTGHKSAITNLEMTPDGRFLCTGSLDGTTRFWDPETGKEVAQFISFSDGEWIVMTPEGYFNASPNGAKYINVRVGNQVFSIDNFYEKYYNPAYVASVLQGKKVDPVADIRNGVALPPEVKIISPETNSELKNDEVTITVSAKDMGGGIDEIRLYHNGKAIGEETRGIKIVPKEKESLKSYTVILIDGVNTFKAVGFSRDRTESNPSEIIIKLLAPEKDISLYVFAVGINKYKNTALNLNFAELDARGIADFFRQNGTELFKKTEIRDIYNEQATKAGILSKLKELERTNPQDAVLIYLAGHGENINEKWYFIPHELIYPEREEDVISKAISSDELAERIKNIKAQKVLVLIDACKSGAALLAFRGFEDRKAISQLSRATGVHVVAASSKDQFAAEVKELGHGVFTYTLLEGLKGKAVSKGQTVTVRKLMGYIEEQLPELTKKYRQEAQYPVVDSKGMDF